MFRKISPSRFNTQGVVMTFSTDSQRRLIWHGMYLFLLGLLIGFAEGASGAYPSRVKRPH
jgi:hypothetical protein